MWIVQTGRGKSSYSNRYTLASASEADFWYSGLNTYGGHKKRIINPEGKVTRRYISS